MSKTLKVWTKSDESTLLKEVNNAKDRKQGFKNAAKILERTESACSARYYSIKAESLKEKIEISRVSEKKGEFYHINGTLKNNEMEIIGEFQIKFG